MVFILFKRLYCVTCVGGGIIVVRYWRWAYSLVFWIFLITFWVGVGLPRLLSVRMKVRSELSWQHSASLSAIGFRVISIGSVILCCVPCSSSWCCLNGFVPFLCLMLSLCFCECLPAVRFFRGGQICARLSWSWLSLMGEALLVWLFWSGSAIHRFSHAASNSSSVSPAVRYRVCRWWLWAVSVPLFLAFHFRCCLWLAGLLMGIDSWALLWVWCRDVFPVDAMSLLLPDAVFFCAVWCVVCGACLSGVVSPI